MKIGFETSWSGENGNEKTRMRMRRRWDAAVFSDEPKIDADSEEVGNIELVKDDS